VARKCGVLPDEQELDNLTLQQYMDMYNQPLTEQAIEVINKLSKISTSSKKMKGKKKNKVMMEPVIEELKKGKKKCNGGGGGASTFVQAGGRHA
jgi:alanyl-tRNA synthetase